MDSALLKVDEEKARHARRVKLRELNAAMDVQVELSKLDSSLKRHTGLIKRMRQSLGTDQRDQILKDIDSLSLEKYIDEIAGAALEGIARCKTEKDVWSAVEVISALHRRFPAAFTPSLVLSLSAALAAPPRASLSALPPEQREKEDSARVSRQRPLLRVCSELALVGIITDGQKRSGGEWIMKVLRELLSNDPTLSSLPLLSIFLKASRYPLKQNLEPCLQQLRTLPKENFPTLLHEDEELVEQEIRDRFKRMCEGYFDSVSKKLTIEHKRLQDQDRRNHEAYIRSGEIFEDRQQAYEKMTKGYEKLLASCQTLSELLYLPMPSLPTVSQKSDSIQIGGNAVSGDEEDPLDLKDFVPKSVLGIESDEKEDNEATEEREKAEKEKADAEAKKLEEELEGLKLDGDRANGRKDDTPEVEMREEEPDGTITPTPTDHRNCFTALLARLPDATNRAMIDQAAIDFAFLNSKAARKRLIKFLNAVPKNRTDLLPHYARFVATLNRYMPDIGAELVALLDEEFRYLQRKKNVVKELAEVRMKNISYLSNLTKFGVVPSHLVLHMFKVCLDDFSGTNVENISMLLEGCGRFLLRSDETRERFGTMLELMRRKQSMQHFDQRQILLLENAYYQCNPPERTPRQQKERTPLELFIRHLIYDVLAKKTIDKVLKLLRKLDWDDPVVQRTLNVNLLAMLTYDLQRYHPAFAISVVDQVLEDIRRGLEQNVYSTNQRRVATIKYLGELYIYRLLGSVLVFDTMWSLVTFGHPEGHPLPRQPCPVDMPNDFFRIRLVCVLLDTVGMCFDRGTQKRKLDNFLVFFQYYVLCKEDLPMDVDFMLSDSIEASGSAIRPKMTMHKTVEEAAVAVDDMFNAALQNAGLSTGEDSGEDSDEEGERPQQQDEEDGDATGQESSNEDRTSSPDPVIVLSTQEHLGPSEEAEAEFEKELAKIITDSSAESRKVDKKTAWWDSAVLGPNVRKKRADEGDVDGGGDNNPNGDAVMQFTVITKRGSKQQGRHLLVPAESALAVHTRSAQLQDKVEQQHLKRLVLDYEQREEAEELKALEVRNRAGAIKIRYVG
ncbi:ARM repeat-containing protein [Suillus subalutaceus]|uniref:ARM repeat-containing protein n=1 Tax=Suillus subalutaceus TaxID=48586 RepID=UPI001B874EF0|nr:ARM repeat-containing protein [Suillus subalutaceus]KAG1878110.1 ARM repeat-containing protein [Suillus subalutaceus]